MNINFTEIIGYLASFVVLLSFVTGNMTKLRLINTIGCLLFVIYGFLLHYSFPIIITNIAIVFINSYYLMNKSTSRKS